MDEEVYLENLFLDSGGIYGYSICGSLQYLKEHNLLSNIKNILGCSVGGIVSMLLCLGFTTEEITAIAFNLDTSKLVNIKKNNFFNIYYKFGFEPGDKLENIIKSLIKNKTGNENYTFQDLYDNYQKKLIIVGSNINTRSHEIFNVENTPQMELWKAIRITCGIPILFQPFEYQGNLYIDGGNSVHNTNYFSDKHKSLGIILENSATHAREIGSFEDFLKNLIFFPLKTLKFSSYNNTNCLEINTSKANINALDFNIHSKDKIELYVLGYQETNKNINRIISNLKNMRPEKKTKDSSIQTES